MANLPYLDDSVMAASPGKNALAATLSDTTDETRPFNYLYVGTSGDVKVTTLGGQVVVFANVPVGYLFVGVARVWSTSTTASNIVGIF